MEGESGWMSRTCQLRVLSNFNWLTQLRDAVGPRVEKAPGLPATSKLPACIQGSELGGAAVGLAQGPHESLARVPAFCCFKPIGFFAASLFSNNIAIQADNPDCSWQDAW